MKRREKYFHKCPECGSFSPWWKRKCYCGYIFIEKIPPLFGRTATSEIARLNEALSQANAEHESELKHIFGRLQLLNLYSDTPILTREDYYKWEADAEAAKKGRKATEADEISEPEVQNVVEQDAQASTPNPRAIHVLLERDDGGPESLSLEQLNALNTANKKTINNITDSNKKKASKGELNPHSVNFSLIKKIRPIHLIVIAALVALLLLIHPWHSHTWVNSTCTSPRTCSVCGKTQGEPNGHSWLKATCSKPQTCLVCGATQGETTDHSWRAATCSAPRTCSVCGATEGNALGHDWIAATCTKPKSCSRCHTTVGSSLGHSWTLETLTAPSRCTRCGEVRAMDLPKSGQVYIGEGLSRWSELTIKASNQSVYVKLKDSTGKDVFAFFARANEITKVSVPAGKYYVYFACGSKWYGPSLYFGEETSFSKDDQIVDFNNYTMTYTMYTVFDGNFTATPVLEDEFD